MLDMHVYVHVCACVSVLTADSSSLLTGRVSSTYFCGYLLFKRVLSSHDSKPPWPSCFMTFPYWEFWRRMTAGFALMCSVTAAIATCNKHCQCRDHAPSQWQRHAGSGIGCSLGWMVVLQAPGKLLSQYHFQCGVFSEALMREKEKIKG